MPNEAATIAGLGPQDLFDLSDACLDVATATRDYRHANLDSLPSKDVEVIAQFEADLNSISVTLRSVAVGQVLAQSEDATKALRDATAKAKGAVASIKKVKAAIGIAGAMLTLAAAVASQNPLAVIAAAAKLASEVQAEA